MPTVYFYSDNQEWVCNGKKRKRPLYHFIDCARKGEPIELWGNPNTLKEMVYVYDVSQLLCKAILTKSCNGGFFNAGNGMPITFEEEIKTIIRVFTENNKESTIIYKPEIDVPREFVMDITNSKKELSYEPLYDIETMLRDFKKKMYSNNIME